MRACIPRTPLLRYLVFSPFPVAIAPSTRVRITLAPFLRVVPFKYLRMEPFYSMFAKNNRVASFFCLVENKNRAEPLYSLFGLKVI